MNQPECPNCGEGIREAQVVHDVLPEGYLWLRPCNCTVPAGAFLEEIEEKVANV